MQLGLLAANLRHLRNLAILDSLSSLLGLANQDLVEEVRGPSWPRTWSDHLFAPPRQFDARKKARRFLAHLQSLGVAVEPWLQQLDAPYDRTKPEQVGQPPGSAAGGVGRAYFLGQHVVKFTTDQKEARVAAFLAGKNIPFLARVDDAWEVALDQDRGGKRLFVIVLEKLNTGVSGKYRAAGTAVYTFLDHFDRPIDSPQRATQVTIDRFLEPRWRRDKDVQTAVFKLFSALKAIYDATGILLQDPHGGNLAFKGRDVGFFDFGRSSTYTAARLPDVQIR